MINYSIDSRLWIGSNKGMILGEGRIALLQSIDEHGSISVAARALGMSYKKAWRLIDTMNKNAKTPLVTQQIGGKGGGGSALSDAGKKAIIIYQELKEKHLDFLKSQQDWLNDAL